MTVAAPACRTTSRDHLGSVREVVDAGTGGLEARFAYDPWGRRTQVAGTMDVDFGFTGHHYHEKSGFHLAPFREYSAELGRWMSRDPAEETFDMNLYRYANNNPVRFLDRTGLASTTGNFNTTEWLSLLNLTPENALKAAQCWNLGNSRHGFNGETDDLGNEEDQYANAMRHCVIACCLASTLEDQFSWLSGKRDYYFLTWLILLAHERSRPEQGGSPTDDHNNDAGVDLKDRDCPENCEKNCQEAWNNGRLATDK